MATTATARYAASIRGGLVHIIHETHPATDDRGALTTWKCTRVTGARNAIHLDEPAGATLCARCVAAADDTDEQHIYVARVGKVIKVGCSSQVGVRVYGLGGELIARVPGDFLDERRVLDLISTRPCRGREWFPASAEAEILAALLKAAGPFNEKDYQDLRNLHARICVACNRELPASVHANTRTCRACRRLEAS